MLGFYRHEGAADAVRVLTDPSVTKYQDHIRLDDPDGPTALSKVRSALEFVEECNRLRAGEGLDALEVSDTAMAVAEAQDSYYMYDEDWNDDDMAGHKFQYTPMRENLDMISDDPFDAWYVQEKKNLETGKGDTGHYKNIVRSGYYVTGFADGQGGEYDYHYRVQDFITDDTLVSIKDYSTEFPIGPTYTPAEYLKRLDGYQTWYDGLVADRKAANRAVDKARAALRHVSGTVRSTDGAPSRTPRSRCRTVPRRCPARPAPTARSTSRPPRTAHGRWPPRPTGTWTARSIPSSSETGRPACGAGWMCGSSPPPPRCPAL